MFLRLFALLFVLIVVCVVCGLSKVCSIDKDFVRLDECNQFSVNWFAGEKKIISSDRFVITNSSYPKSSVLTIKNFTLEDENDYSCRDLHSGKIVHNFTVVAPPVKYVQDISTSIYDGTALEINCGVLLGRITRNCDHGFMLLSYEDQSNISEYISFDKVKYTPVGESAWLPSLMVSSLTPNIRHIQCNFVYDACDDVCPSSCPTCDEGPLYNIIYPLVVEITGSHTNDDTVAEGSIVNLGCNASERSNAFGSVIFNIYWIIREAETNQIVQEINNNSHILHFNVTNDVMITCYAQGEVHDHKIKSSASVNLTIAPNLSERNIHTSMENCSSITIHLNSSTIASYIDVYVSIGNVTTNIEHNSLRQTIHLERALINNGGSFLHYFSIVNGVKGNVYTQSIPTCNSSIITISFNSSWCPRERKTELEVEGIIHAFLRNVTDVCVFHVCPVFNKHNWRITSIDDCDVTIVFDGLPVEELRSSLQLACDMSGECRLRSDSDSPNLENPWTMLNWMLIFMYILIPILLLTVIILLFCIFHKVVKNGIKNRKDVEQVNRIHGPVTEQTVTTDKDNNCDIRTMSTVTSCCASSCSRSGVSSRQHPAALQHQHHLHPLPQHTFSPHKVTANHPTTISLNITVDDLPQPFLTLFNELGALECEKRTRSSIDTGLGTDTNIENFSDGQSHKQVSYNSSGYGSQATQHSTNDPSVLNPHRNFENFTLQHECTNSTVTETIL